MRTWAGRRSRRPRVRRLTRRRGQRRVSRRTAEELPSVRGRRQLPARSLSAPSASSRTTSAAGTHIAFVEYVHPATARAFKYADIYTVDA